VGLLAPAELLGASRPPARSFAGLSEEAACCPCNLKEGPDKRGRALPGEALPYCSSGEIDSEHLGSRLVQPTALGQGPGVHGVESDVIDQLPHYSLGVLVVAGDRNAEATGIPGRSAEVTEVAPVDGVEGLHHAGPARCDWSSSLEVVRSESRSAKYPSRPG
jgi:hypothetical protein